MAYDFLIHHEEDSVGVLVRDVTKRERLKGGLLEGGDLEVEVEAREDILLSQKIAIKKVLPGEAIKKYGREIGEAYEAIAIGDWVHVHNLRSVRWSE